MAVLTVPLNSSAFWVGVSVALAVAPLNGETLAASLCGLPSHGLLLRHGHVGVLPSYCLILVVDALPVAIEVDEPSPVDVVGQFLDFAGREFVLLCDLLRPCEYSKQIFSREPTLLLEPREVFFVIEVFLVADPGVVLPGVDANFHVGLLSTDHAEAVPCEHGLGG